ncbi:MAG: hypothetical protein ABL930_13415 [Pseudobdellovibrio sp.]
MEIVMKLLEHWSVVIYFFFSIQIVKLIGGFYLKIVEIRALNKDQIKVAISQNECVFEIQSSTVKIEDLHKLQNEKLLAQNKLNAS